MDQAEIEKRKSEPPFSGKYAVCGTPLFHFDPKNIKTEDDFSYCDNSFALDFKEEE